jgi:hypothetical protein
VGLVLELNDLDLDEIASALADQNHYEYQYLVNPDTGEIVLWSAETGIDGHTPIDLEDLDPDLVGIDPLPSYIWYEDMADFASEVSDEQAGRRLERAIRGKGARLKVLSGQMGLVRRWPGRRHSDSGAGRSSVVIVGGKCATGGREYSNDLGG